MKLGVAMQEKSIAEKVEWMKEGLDKMLGVANDVNDPDTWLARGFINDTAEKIEEWMEAHYGDGE